MGSNVNVDDLGNIERDIMIDIDNYQYYNNADSNLYFHSFASDFKKVFELLSKHLKNLSGRITEEESDLTKYDSQFQNEDLLVLAQEMLTIQSNMISNISNRRTKRQTEIKGAYKQHMLAKANNDTFYDYFEEQRNDFTFG